MLEWRKEDLLYICFFSKSVSVDPELLLHNLFWSLCLPIPRSSPICLGGKQRAKPWCTTLPVDCVTSQSRRAENETSQGESSYLYNRPLGHYRWQPGKPAISSAWPGLSNSNNSSQHECREGLIILPLLTPHIPTAGAPRGIEDISPPLENLSLTSAPCLTSHLTALQWENTPARLKKCHVKWTHFLFQILDRFEDERKVVCYVYF